MYTVRKSVADFIAVRDCDSIAKLCDLKFSQIEGNGRKFSSLEVQYRYRLEMWWLIGSAPDY